MRFKQHWDNVAREIGRESSVKKIPSRNGMPKDEYQMLLESEHAIVPGTPAYFALAREFMLLEIRLGRSLKDGRQVSWLPGDSINGFFMLLGASGSGKTETLKLMGSQLVNQAIPVFVLDFHGDIDFPYLNSVLLSSGYESIYGISPLEIDATNPGKQGLYEQRLAVVEMLHRAVPTLSVKQRDILLRAVETAYVMAGIEDFNPYTWRNQPPSFGMVADVLHGWANEDEMKAHRQSISGCLTAVSAIFGHPVFNRINNLSLGEMLSSNWRLDLSHLDESVQVIVAETVLRMIFRSLRARGPVAHACSDSERFRLFILIDEAKILAMGGGDPDKRTRILNVLATEGRKFGIGLILASQTSAHFGQDVRRNVASRLVLQATDAADARQNAADIQVAPADLLNLPGRGAGYLRTGQYEAERIQVVL